jgi:CHAT domain-containing protein
MPHTAGLPELPGTAAEAARLRTRYPDTAELANTGATVEAVLNALPQASFAHFACHAGSHPVEPSKSGLHLHDAVLSVPEVSKLRLRSGELAYLSACSTGQGSLYQADEAIQLGSAFQLAGYRHVIATLWPVDDAVAAAAAHRFYELLGDSPSADRAARALHEVTRGLRDRYPRQPHLWAPFVHSGP